MRVAVVAGVLLALVFGAPGVAHALTPPPTVLDFEGLAADEPIDSNAYPGVTMAAPGPCFSFGLAAAPLECTTVVSPGHDSAQGLEVFNSVLELTFDAPQAGVSMWVSGPGAEGGITVDGWAAPPGPSEPPLVSTTVSSNDSFGGAAVLRTVGPQIGFVRLSCACFQITVDDVTFSTLEQPDTEILSGPAAVSRSTGASFVFVGNQPGTGYFCALDGGASAPCRAPYSVGGLAAGSHTLRVMMRDRFGTVDPTPAVYTWTVDLTPPPAPPAPPAPPDADGDGVPDVSDNCPEAANGAQGDGDGDGVGDGCEVGEPGTDVPVTGRRVIVEVVSGDVFIKLPITRRLAQSAPISGFVPLKGIASVPVGSVVDARRGRLLLQSTVDGRRIGHGGRRQSATLSAGIFKIRQQRTATASRKRIPTDFLLRSAPGARAACVHSGNSGPIKGRGRHTVRGLAATAKGLFRVVGAAGMTTARNATFVTEDRCNGTRTDVGKGRVAVFDRRRHRRIVVPAGQTYLVRARLFAARQAR